MAAAVEPITPFTISLPTLGAWTTLDVTADCPAGTGVLIARVKSGSGSQFYEIGFRHPDDTTDQPNRGDIPPRNGTNDAASTWYALVKEDAGTRTIQYWIANANIVPTFHAAIPASKVKTFTTPVNYDAAPGFANAQVDIDITANVDGGDTPIAALFRARGKAGGLYDSISMGEAGNAAPSPRRDASFIDFLVPIDGVNEFRVHRDNDLNPADETSYQFRLLFYFKEGLTKDPALNGRVDDPTLTDGTFELQAPGPAGSVGVFVKGQGDTATGSWGVRPPGTQGNFYDDLAERGAQGQYVAYTELDASQQYEAARTNSTVWVRPLFWVDEDTGGGTAPSFPGPDLGPYTDEENVAITPLDVSGSFDPGNGANPTYTDSGLPPGLGVDPLLGIISGTPTTPGMYSGCQITLTTDEPPAATSNSFQWTINDITPPNLSDPTAINITQTAATPRVTTDEGNGTLYAYLTPAGANPDEAAIRLSGESQAVSTAGVKTFTEVTGLSAGTPYQLSYLQDDAVGNTSSIARHSFSTLHSEPSFTGNIANQTNTAGDSVNLDISTEFDEGTAAPTTGYTVTAGTLPSGLTLSSATGVISGTIADDDQLGIEITFTTAAGAATSNPFSWTVSAAPVPPTFTGNIANQSNVENQDIGTVDFSTEFDEGNGTGVTYAVATGTLPAGLSLNSGSGEVTGIPTTVQTQTGLSISCTTSNGVDTSNVFQWEITTAPTTQIYTVDSAKPVGSLSVLDNATGIVIGTTEVEVPLATDLGETITWYTAPFDGTYLADGVPTTQTFQVRDRANSGAAWEPFVTITVESGVAPTFPGNIANQTDLQQSAITPLDTSLQFNEGNGTGVTYSLASGELPPGLLLDENTGVIDGTPTVVGTQTGIVVRLTTSEGQADSNPFQWEITAAATAPTFTGNIVDRDVLADGSTPISPVDVSTEFDEGTGTPTTGYTVQSGFLLPGLSLDSGTGVISGIPVFVGVTDPTVIRFTTDEGFADSNPFVWEGMSPPTFPGPNIANQNDDEDTAITPLDVSGSFAPGTGDNPTYSDSGLPPGLGVNPTTGVITGTPTTPGTYSNCVITLTTTIGGAVAVNSNTFEWEVVDTVAPVLSNPQAVGIGPTNVTPRCTTDEGNGTAWAYVTADAANPTAAAIKANGTSLAVSAAGVLNWPNVSSLASSTPYQISFVHDDAGSNESNVVRVSFTTSAASTISRAPVRQILRNATRPQIRTLT